MGVSRGKQFEGVIKEAFQKVPELSIDRIHDQTTGFVGSSNICDFIIYKKPYELYLECKSCYGNTLNFSNISKNQWEGLLEKSQIDGVIAGVMIWFIDHDKTIFVPIQTLNKWKEEGCKSVNVKSADGMLVIKVNGRKKRTFFDYDMTHFWDDLRKNYETNR